MEKFKLPPNLQHAVLGKIYPWEEYNVTILLQFLYNHAVDSGFTGDFEDFKVRFGADLSNPDYYEGYKGEYKVIPLPLVSQILRTADKVLKEDVIIDAIPYQETSNIAGGYTVNIG